MLSLTIIITIIIITVAKFPAYFFPWFFRKEAKAAPKRPRMNGQFMRKVIVKENGVPVAHFYMAPRGGDYVGR